MSRDAAFDAWVDEARAVPFEQALGPHRDRLKRSAGGRELVGPCPVCGGTDRFSINLTKGVFNCRMGGRAGDVIELVEYMEGASFLRACEILTGRPSPRGRGETAQEAAERARERAARDEAGRAKAAKDEEASAFYRERERRQTHDAWEAARPIGGTLAALYLAHRCIEAPPGARLRYAARHPYWHHPKGGRRRIIHEGPALLAGITDSDGRWRGLHATWLDPRLAQGGVPDEENGRATITDPDTGEILAAKKVRGSAMGNRIELVRVHEPRALLLGEGIETVLSGWIALSRHRPELVDGMAAWAAMSLGNLCGRATGNVQHPTERVVRAGGKDGGPLRVAGPDPDIRSPAVIVPESVEVLRLLGDGDSEPFFTEQAMTRAARRHAVRRDGTLRTVILAMAEPGTDFNTMLRRAA